MRILLVRLLIDVFKAICNGDCVNLKTSGIYRIVCIKNGRYYYGSPNNIGLRWKQHLRSLRERNHYNIYMQRVWNKYGENSFHIELVENISNDKLLDTEQLYLDEHIDNPKCMNIAKDTLAPTRGRHIWPNGRVFSKQTRQKISKTIQHLWNTGCYSSPSRGKKIGKALEGEKHVGSKLTESDIHQIREKYIPYTYSYSTLAKEYGVDKKLIINIVKRRTWKHI